MILRVDTFHFGMQQKMSEKNFEESYQFSVNWLDLKILTQHSEGKFQVLFFFFFHFLHYLFFSLFS